MYISNKVTKEQLHKQLQKKLYQHREIKVQLNPYTSVKRRRKKPKKLFISKRFIICFFFSFLFLQFYLFARVFFTDLKLKFFTWSRNCLAVLRPLSLPRLWCDPSHLWYGEMTTI